MECNKLSLQWWLAFHLGQRVSGRGLVRVRQALVCGELRVFAAQPGVG